MNQKRPLTYETEVLNILIYEFPFSKKAEAEEKIEKRLKRKKLGPYDAERIELLRRLKNDLQEEISKAEKSIYYTGRHDKYVDLRDFDIERLAKDMISRHPQVPAAEIEEFVPFCVFTYYLR